MGNNTQTQHLHSNAYNDSIKHTPSALFTVNISKCTQVLPWVCSSPSPSSPSPRSRIAGPAAAPSPWPDWPGPRRPRARSARPPRARRAMSRAPAWVCAPCRGGRQCTSWLARRPWHGWSLSPAPVTGCQASPLPNRNFNDNEIMLLLLKIV